MVAPILPPEVARRVAGGGDRIAIGTPGSRTSYDPPRMGRRSINALMEGLKVIPPPGVGLQGGGIFFVSGGRTRLSKHSEVEEGNGVFQPVLLVLDGWHLPGGYTGRNADVPFSNARRESPCGLRRVGGG